MIKMLKQVMYATLEILRKYHDTNNLGGNQVQDANSKLAMHRNNCKNES